MSISGSKFEGKSVSQPLAVAALQRWIGTFDVGTRARGRAYFEERRVLHARAPADHYVEAVVKGGDDYPVTLFLRDRTWSSRCGCPMAVDCKHVVATALAWVASSGAGIERTAASKPELQVPSQAVLIPTSQVHRPRTERKRTFTEEWRPTLEQDLLRPVRRNSAYGSNRFRTVKTASRSSA